MIDCWNDEKVNRDIARDHTENIFVTLTIIVIAVY